MPKSIKVALVIIWADLALSVLAGLLDKLTGSISVGAFSFALITTALFTIVPYKIANKRNAARYFWMVINIFGYVLFIGVPNVEGVGKFTGVLTWVTLPAVVYSIYLLFVHEANEWFCKRVNVNKT